MTRKLKHRSHGRAQAPSEKDTKTPALADRSGWVSGDARPAVDGRVLWHNDDWVVTPSGLHSMWDRWHLPREQLLGLRDRAAAAFSKLPAGLFWPAVEVALAVHFPEERTIDEQRAWLRKQPAEAGAGQARGRRHA